MSDQDEVMRMLADPWWRFRNLYHIKSEDRGSVIPFTPYPEQEEVFRAVYEEGHQRIIIPKARRRGMSTGIEVMMTDQALQNPGFECGIVDRNQSEASKKLSNIAKVSIDKLPPFMRDDVKFDKSNDDQLSFSSRSADDDTTSHIYAGTTYRGGNCNFLHVSEWGWIQCEDPKRSEEIQTGAIQAARKGTILVETTWKGGKRGHLWEYTKEALETADEHKHARSWRVMFFPWHTDPNYRVRSSSPIRPEVMDYFEMLANEKKIIVDEDQMRWYQEEAWPLNNNRFGEYPSTLEECFKSPMEGIIYELEMARVLAERRISNIPVEPGLPVFAVFDIGRNDAMPLGFIQVVGKEIRVLDYYCTHRESITHYANYIRNWQLKKKVDDIRILLPHDGKRVALQSDTSIVDKFHEMGFHNVQAVDKIPRVWAGINYVRDTFPYLWFDKTALERTFSRGKKEFPSLGECLNNYHQAEDKSGMMVSMEPVHDDYSHGCDMLRVFCEAWQAGKIGRQAMRAAPADDFGGGEGSKTMLSGAHAWRGKRTW